jgi:FkbM family methyltransferase
MLMGRPVLTHAELFRSRQTEPHVLRWISDALKRGDVCFDVGAHHGWMSMVAARKVGIDGYVVAFEPTPLLVHYLNYIKRANRMHQLQIVPKAVAECDASHRPFRVIGNGNSFMNAFPDLQLPEDSVRNSSILEMETVSLDTFILTSGLIPNLIKIDTEGAELLVCLGAKKLIEAHHPTLIIATHPLWLPRGQKIEDLFRFLDSCGYRAVDSRLCEYEGSQFGDFLYQ